jgi:hypothetical protein
VPWDDLRDYLVALFVYPGLLTLAGLGLAAEMGAAWALVPERGGAASAAAATPVSYTQIRAHETTLHRGLRLMGV